MHVWELKCRSIKFILLSVFHGRLPRRSAPRVPGKWSFHLPEPATPDGLCFLSVGQNHLCPAVFRGAAGRSPVTAATTSVPLAAGPTGKRLPGKTHRSVCSPKFRGLLWLKCADWCLQPPGQASIFQWLASTTYLVTLGKYVTSPTVT